MFVILNKWCVPQDNSSHCIMLICITLGSNNHHPEPFGWGKCPDCLTSSSVVQPRFTPSAFWCGCSVCSPAPAVCSLPFNNLPLAKSLTLWLGCSGIVCISHQEVRNMRPRSRLSSLDPCCRFNSAEIRCDFSPAFKSSVGSIRQPAASSPQSQSKASVFLSTWNKRHFERWMKFDSKRLVSHSSAEVGTFLCAHLEVNMSMYKQDLWHHLQLG